MNINRHFSSFIDKILITNQIQSKILFKFSTKDVRTIIDTVDYFYDVMSKKCQINMSSPQQEKSFDFIMLYIYRSDV